MTGSLPDMYEGFATHRIDGAHGPVFARSGGKGPPLLLVHGYPQTHVEWHKMASALARHFTLIIPDLRGYGASSAPASEKGALYSKREMGNDLLRLMDELGHSQFFYAGHDRGARVGYRLALDHPGRVKKLSILDIIPTVSMWDGMDAKRAMQVYHWQFLAQPAPLPETLIGGAPVHYIDHTLASWTKTKSLSAFSAGALAHYRAFFSQSAHIHATCEDYRAGATIDVDCDRIDLNAGKKLQCPAQILWGAVGIPAAGASPLDVWRATFAPQAVGQAIESGHFLPEENPDDTAAALIAFLHA
ncbi:MAG: alpha/beta fold hydrolase [Beijerinckiaceae bacterium]